MSPLTRGGRRGQAPPAARGTLPDPHSKQHPWAARPGTAQGKTWSLSLVVKVEESVWARWHSYRLVCACAHPAKAPCSPQGRPSGQHACCNQEGHASGLAELIPAPGRDKVPSLTRIQVSESGLPKPGSSSLRGSDQDRLQEASSSLLSL